MFLSCNSSLDRRRLRRRAVLNPTLQLAENRRGLAAGPAETVCYAWRFEVAVEIVDVGRDAGDGLVVALGGAGRDDFVVLLFE